LHFSRANVDVGAHRIGRVARRGIGVARRGIGVARRGIGVACRGIGDVRRPCVDDVHRGVVDIDGCVVNVSGGIARIDFIAASVSPRGIRRINDGGLARIRFAYDVRSSIGRPIDRRTILTRRGIRRVDSGRSIGLRHVSP
jgi:hypothetical protein